MARKKKNVDVELGFDDSLYGAVSHWQRNVSFAFLLFSIFWFFSIFGMSGELGDKLHTASTGMFGAFAYTFPFVTTWLTYVLFREKLFKIFTKNFFLSAATLGLIYTLLSFIKIDSNSLMGGLGGRISTSLSHNIGTIPSVLLFTFGLVALLTYSLNLTHLLDGIFSENQDDESEEENNSPKLKQISAGNSNQDEDTNSDEKKVGIFSFFTNIFSRKNNNPNSDTEDLDGEVTDEDDASHDNQKDVREELFDSIYEQINKETKNKNSTKNLVAKSVSEEDELSSSEVDEVSKELTTSRKSTGTNYNVTSYERPPLNLYEEDNGKPSAGDNKENARLIKRTMQNFGITVEMEEVSVGPTVTRYCLKPAQGVKLSKIATLDKNLAMELSTTSVRIEAPIPGRSVVGIEIPNRTKTTLGIGTLFDHPHFQEDKTPLLMAIGKDISGNPIFANLAKIPHLLIAGTTGSGKSVMIHTLIQSLIYRNSPSDLKFIMIDPKKVELAFYNKLPHLYTPVIKDPKKAVQTLNWLVQEMERRYEVLEEHGKQNIIGYHTLINEKYKKAESSRRPVMEDLPEKMPYIVVVIDELADFMMAYPKEMESGIVRLAQKSRAVGIHLILSTQKPLANIISSVIKANVPGRIALKVTNRMDSMVIIDQIGAEKLLGNGDLLFMNSDGSDIKRIQSPFVSDKEVVRVVDYLKGKYDEFVAEELVLPQANGGNVAGSYDSGDMSDKDDRYEEAKEIVLMTKNTSITHLQRKMGIGYSRAAKLIDMLESAGIVGKQNGSKPREILVENNQKSGPSSSELEDEADEILQKSGSTDDIDLDEERIF
jgi:S-DNA-T family DNA segregation ATPase FtsK/SpoIIIE